MNDLELGLALSRSVSGTVLDYRWRGRLTRPDEFYTSGTELGGARAEVGIIVEPQGPSWRFGATGYYVAEAVSLEGDSAIVGRWGSIPIQDGTQTNVDLDLDGSYRIEGRQPLVTFASRTFVLNRIVIPKIVFGRRDTISVAEFDAMYPGDARPLQIELHDYVPHAPVSGRVEVQGFGWLDIVDDFDPEFHGTRQTTFQGRPGGFFVHTGDPRAQDMGLGIHLLTSSRLEGRYQLSGPVITTTPAGFVAVALGGQ